MSVQRQRYGKLSENGCQIYGGDVLSAEVGSEILDLLRRELIGPDPGLPAQQLNREEILRPQDPPRLRYSTGVLFPMRSAVPDQVAATEELVEGTDTAPPEGSEESAETASEELTGSRVDIRSELQPETDIDLNLANQYLPSAMG